MVCILGCVFFFVLRQDAHVTTDCGAVGNLKGPPVNAPDDVHAAAMALMNGTDLEKLSWLYYAHGATSMFVRVCRKLTWILFGCLPHIPRRYLCKWKVVDLVLFIDLKGKKQRDFPPLQKWINIDSKQTPQIVYSWQWATNIGPLNKGLP